MSDRRQQLEDMMSSAEMSQTTLSAVLGVSLNTVSRWLANTRHAIPVPEYAFAFLAAYNAVAKSHRPQLLAKLMSEKSAPAARAGASDSQ
ncbi:hypothetical protein BA190_09245 [Labrys sp. WJW]|uniref:helix-turn-helix transcriptional regulator n=1 Tax=Labrys sp. WJW TaxID=1737983 RepID=UPI0008333AA2|nr:helix-turn-helix transcriptional regulator [Labrys sp. WJW]OCC05090.1 hypothetical protein BA190_09245 [Labrys sp. WJW]